MFFATYLVAAKNRSWVASQEIERTTMNDNISSNTAKTDEKSALIPGTSDDDEQRYGISTFRVHKESGFTWRRVLVFVLQIVPSIPLAGWILFSSPPAFDVPEGNPVRNALVFTWLLIVLLAYEAKILYIERQYMLVEVFFVLPVIFPAMIVYIAVFTRKNNSPIGATDFIAGVFVLFGIFLNEWPEIMRTRWKKRAENQGKLYTVGFFSYVRNPNYLGDVIWATGWAMASSWAVAWVPIMITCVFIFMYIPEKESYLAKRYESEWPAYEAKTCKLFPFIY